MLLKNICVLTMGQSPDSKTYNKTGLGLPFYQGNADFGEEHPTPTTWCTSPKKIARKNDILLSVRAPIGDLNVANEDCCIGRGLASIRSQNNQYLLNDYLFTFIDSKKEFLINAGTGATFKAIGKSVIENLELTIPTIEKQKNITSCIAKIKQTIKNKKEQLKSLDELVKSRFIGQEVAC